MFDESVTFIEAGSRTDPYSGETVKDDWENPVAVHTDVCAVEPVGSRTFAPGSSGSEEPIQDGRQAIIIGYRLYFDHNVDIDRTWRATVRGDTLEVAGKPAEWQLSGWDAGTVAEVRFMEG